MPLAMAVLHFLLFIYPFSMNTDDCHDQIFLNFQQPPPANCKETDMFTFCCFYKHFVSDTWQMFCIKLLHSFPSNLKYSLSKPPLKYARDTSISKTIQHHYHFSDRTSGPLCDPVFSVNPFLPARRKPLSLLGK